MLAGAPASSWRTWPKRSSSWSHASSKALEHLAAMVSGELELRLMVFRSAAAEQPMREMVH